MKRASLRADPEPGPVPAAPAWTYPPTQVVVPVDFGDASAHALAVAAAIASRYGSRLTALHADIVDAPVYFTHEQARAIDRQRTVARWAVERHLSQLVHRVTAWRTEVRFVGESPTTAIIDAARGADLVVMGTHGRHGPTRWWLGSVAERVVRESSGPVLVVRAAEGAPAPEAMFRRPVMVAARSARRMVRRDRRTAHQDLSAADAGRAVRLSRRG